MNCADIKALLSALIDDEIDPPTRHEAERHLADCAPCRELISHAETIDALIIGDASELAGEAGLSAAFIDNVLNRTVFEDQRVLRSRAWTTWTGWFAAAASLLLAMSIWVMDRAELADTPFGESSSDDRSASASTFMTPANLIAQSWVYESPQPAERFRLPEHALPEQASKDSSIAAPPIDPVIDPLIEGATFAELPTNESSIAANAQAEIPRVLPWEDAETLYSTMLVLDMLTAPGPTPGEINVAEGEQAQLVVEYDRLLPRLEDAMSRLHTNDRAATWAAHSLLKRLTSEPVNPDLLRALREQIIALDLADHLQQTIGDRFDHARNP